MDEFYRCPDPAHPNILCFSKLTHFLCSSLFCTFLLLLYFRNTDLRTFISLSRLPVTGKPEMLLPQFINLSVVFHSSRFPNSFHKRKRRTTVNSTVFSLQQGCFFSNSYDSAHNSQQSAFPHSLLPKCNLSTQDSGLFVRGLKVLFGASINFLVNNDSV